MATSKSNFHRAIAPLIIAALFALIGTGHDALLAVHATLSHPAPQCESDHEHHDHKQQAPDRGESDECGVCRSLMLAQSMKGIDGFERTTIVFDEFVERIRTERQAAASTVVRESRARDPPTRRV